MVDAAEVAREAGLGRRINTVMQTCFFALSGVLPRDEAIAGIKDAIEKTYGKRGEVVLDRNFAAVDGALDALPPGPGPGGGHRHPAPAPAVSDEAPDFVKRVTARMMEGKGDLLPVSALPVDGTFPTGTARYEKRCWPPRSRSGTRRSASSAACAPWSARTPPSGPRCSPPRPCDGAPGRFVSKDFRSRDLPGMS